MSRLLAAALLAAGTLLAAHPAAGQNVCTLVYQTGGWTSSGPEGDRVIHASGPLLIRCAAGEELRADSAVLYQSIDEVHLFRRVDYQDAARALTSDYATYNGGSGRLWATGNVVYTDRVRGSTLRGPNLEYFRATAERPETQAVATGRPHLTVAPREGDGAPMEVDADQITTLGERFVTAEGNVVIEGERMNAWAGLAHYDADEDRLELRRNARAAGESFDLRAEYIRSEMDDGALREVLARGRARLIEARMRVSGPQIRMFFERDSLERLVSGHGPSASEGGAGRSVALARGFRMEADSLEALTPGQRVRQVVALGEARGEAWDTTRVVGPDPADPEAPDAAPELALGELDLIFADTLYGFFRDDAAEVALAAERSPEADAEEAEAEDAGAEPPATPAAPRAAGEEEEARLERVLAIGNARSLYRLAPSREEADARRGINYVIGDTIELSFEEGEVDTAVVRGMKKGLYLDPAQLAASGGESVEIPGTREEAEEEMVEETEETLEVGPGDAESPGPAEEAGTTPALPPPGRAP